MIKNHPYQFVYFNKFAGEDIANSFDVDYWGVSNKSALTYIVSNDKEDRLKIYVSSNSPYHFSSLLMDKSNRKRLKFVNNISDADFLVTNHFYKKGNPTFINQELKKKFNLYKEYKVDDLIINSIYKTK